ncbi:colicin E3/pyocin S6 family cytotoxin [Pseudomonas sp. P8_250]|nr:colicin E3/pyocin S6 family cytotoxin [Pseudomonas sp. P8_250]WPN44413.1 colicin E3/pyocin S6 family cytotoxin [Pseudomonas sp. P8_229]
MRSPSGAVEKYDARGKHIGEFDPNTGEPTSTKKNKKSKNGKKRSIEP